MNARRWAVVGETLRNAIAALQAAGVDSPRLDAELLLAHALNQSRAFVIAHPDSPLSVEQQTHFGRLLARRITREPLAYITGRRWFFGLEFEVTPAVLTPRPETEMLVEAALDWLGSRPLPSPSLIDVGTGSGAIAISVAANTPTDVRILASDISTGALAVARRNADRLAPGRIHFLHSDLLAALDESVDLILANLPYVAADQAADLMPEVRDHEPAGALFSENRGLAHIERLITQASDHLKPGGALMLEIGYDQGQRVQSLARTTFPQAAINLHHDLAGLDRMVVVQVS
ncbi:MAG: peptide chain release factor N(5)-glutamine methyltransferase [Caldilineales bacterium]|nr:peptide chain release factor N(5)-glutamine methyltransferase [Caldilineales bacterium]